MKANDGQCLNLVSSDMSAAVLTLLDWTLVHHRYLPNNVGTQLLLSTGSILRQIGVNEIA